VPTFDDYDLTSARGRPTQILVVDAHGRSAPRTISVPGDETTLLGGRPDVWAPDVGEAA
jgi:hypothetical protein